jgi:hypothetical protein
MDALGVKYQMAALVQGSFMTWARMIVLQLHGVIIF